MKKGILMLLGLILFLAACASDKDYNQQLQTWQGQSVEYLYNDWGQPTSINQLPNGNMLVIYTQSNEQTEGQEVAFEQEISGNAPPYASNQFFNTQNTYFCSTTFTVVDGVITDYAYEGTSCE